MNLSQIRSLAKILTENGLTCLEVRSGEETVRLERSPNPSSGVPAPVQAPAAQPKAEEKTAPVESAQALREIKSPMVGVFYAASSPEAEPFVKVGSHVKKGDILCVLEAMKLMNEVSAEEDGEVAEVCAKNGQVVEYGQTLFKLR